MGHEDDRIALLIELLEEYEHLERGARIEVTSGLVGQQHRRIVHQSAGNGDTLHLTTRHLVRLVVHTVAQSYGLQGLDGFLPTLGSGDLGVIHQRQLHILQGGRLRQEVITLEHEADLTVAQFGALGLRHRANADAIEEVLTRRGGIQTAQLVEQRRLAGTGGTLNGDELALVDLERDTTQRLHRLLAHLEVALDVL